MKLSKTTTTLTPSLFLLSSCSTQQCHGLSFEHTVKNFRPVIPSSPSSPLYRSACLDDLSTSDARALLNGSAFASPKPLAAILDLRNTDEIQKGKAKRTPGSQLFYSSLQYSSHPPPPSSSSNQQPVLYHAPLLQNINAFWDEAINRMDTSTRLISTIQTIYQGGALDRAAARYLEKEGLSELYTIMLCSNARQMKRALQLCMAHVAEEEGGGGGPVLIHCQKGKDRTGVLSMLLQYACGDDNMNDDLEEEIVRLYSLSGDLLGGKDATSYSSSSSFQSESSSSGTMLDWSKFRGSPPSAMKKTLEYINHVYGSVDGYMDYIDFGAEDRNTLRQSIERLSRIDNGNIEL